MAYLGFSRGWGAKLIIKKTITLKDFYLKTMKMNEIGPGRKYASLAPQPNPHPAPTATRRMRQCISLFDHYHYTSSEKIFFIISVETFISLLWSKMKFLSELKIVLIIVVTLFMDTVSQMVLSIWGISFNIRQLIKFDTKIVIKWDLKWIIFSAATIGGWS